MYSLSDLYEKGSGSTAVSIFMGVVTCLFFTTGLFLIIGAHSSTQSQQVNTAIATLKKALGQNGKSNNAALLSLETALATQSKSSGGKATTGYPTAVEFDTLVVRGSSTLQGSVKTAKDLSVGGDLAASRNASVNGDLSVGGDANVATGLGVLGNVLLRGNLSGSGNTVFSGSLNVGGNASLAGLNTQGPTALNGSLSSAGNANFNGSLTVAGSTSLSNLTTQGSSTLNGSLLATGSGTVGSNLTVAANTTIGTNLSVGGSASLAGGLGIGGTANFQNGLAQSGGDTSIDGNLTVSGTTTLNGNLLAGSGTLNNLLNVSGTATIDGDLTVETTVVSGSTVGGTLTVGDFVFNADGTSSVNSHAGTTATCTAGQHLSADRVEGGLITTGSCIADGSDNGKDLAEIYASDQSLSAGDVVSIDPAKPEYVVKSDGPGDNRVIGVVSTQPGYTLGVGDNGYPVALAGRVPVKVTAEGGPIAAGDYLTSASTAGYAKKAAFGEKTIGQALTGLDGGSGSLIMFVNVSGGNSQAGLLQSTQTNIQVGGGSFTGLSVSGLAVANQLEVSGLAKTKDLQVTGSASLASLQILGHITGNDDTRGSVTIPAGQTSVTKTFNQPYASAPVIVASPDNQPASFSATSTNTSFEIKLAAPQATDVKFNYLIQE